MLVSFPVAILIGSILGTMAGLGIGGGSLLILWLTMALQMPASTARVINLLFFLPTAVISSFIRHKQGTLNNKSILSAVLWGCLGAIVFSRLSYLIDDTMLRRLFGILLLFTGIRELTYRPRNAK